MPRKGDYLQRWAGAYERYAKYAAFQGKDHPCNQSWNEPSLTDELKQANDYLVTDLGYLDRYYAEIRDFLNLAEAARRTPNNARVQQGLAAKEAELLSMPDTLWPYFHGYKGGLERLRSVAEAIDDYLELIRLERIRRPSDGEIMMFIELLREVQSLSNKVRQDWEDEVRKGPNDPYDLYSFTAYVDRRRQTLLALRTPLPPTPGTTGTNAS